MPPWSDLLVLSGIVVSSTWWMARLRRLGLRGGRHAAAAVVGFLGLALIVTMTAHCVDVLSRLAVGTGYDGAAFVYNFRTYSLLLLGSILIVTGVLLLRTSSSIGRLNVTHGSAVRRLLTVLALVVPLIPIHGFFAIPITVIAAIAMLLVLWRVHRPPRPAEPVAAVLAPR